MAERSKYLASLDRESRTSLVRRLHDRQGGKCFICDDRIDLDLQADSLDVDHVVPLAEYGKDEENNFALTHAPCNRSKGASDLRVARRMAEFERLQETARQAGRRGANLGDVLQRHGGAIARLRVKREALRAPSRSACIPSATGSRAEGSPTVPPSRCSESPRGIRGSCGRTSSRQPEVFPGRFSK